MKKLFIGIVLLISLFFIGIERLNYLSQKEIKLDNFSTFNKIEIYAAYILMNVLGYPLYPEISKEAMLMLNPNVRNKEIHFESNFFLDSKVIKQAIDNYTKPTTLYWHPSNYVIGNPEARVSLTFNGAKLIKKNTTVKVVVPCSWPKWSNYKDKTYTTPLSKFPEIRVQEGLFWVLEQEGWIHPYTAIWKTKLPNL
tara:strand:- start:595 stop:1182 length:588 start_codon:yes stop_codon:yes gene_type:complete